MAGDYILCSALKIIANSVYGLMAFSQYPSYSSPMCSSTVIGAGRWLLQVLHMVCKFYPDTVPVYGDTDSLFCACRAPDTDVDGGTSCSSRHRRCGGDASEMSKEVSSIVSHILSFTPFSSVGLSQVLPTNPLSSPVYTRMIVLKSKMYALLDSVGKMELTGVSAVRLNTPPIQTAYTMEILTMALAVTDRSELRELVMRMATTLINHRE